ncbi:MAG: serine hydrolase [Candidatus Marinimicrobia bacterium]|nr:serine hydrolase [Candidatus Neomarinimicrobiota bacterium]
MNKWTMKIVALGLLMMVGCAPISSLVEVSPDPSRLIEQLSLKQKVAQMFIVRYTGGFYNNSSYSYQQIKRLVEEEGIGGIIPFFGNIHGTIGNFNELQKLAEIPLLVAADYERGVGQQLDGATLFPSNMALAATNSPELAYKQGMITAKEARAVGVHVTFAPVMDVNSNPDNPIINFRSFGDSPEIVSKFGVEFIKGAQDNGLIATAKHFPGHGNTGTDSHTTLPVITTEKDEFENVDLAPFISAINAGVNMIMVGHISVPALDITGKPATLSPTLTQKLLRETLGFEGVIVTDALEMGGITEAFWAGEAAIRAIESGSDWVLLPMDVEKAIEAVIDAVQTGRISQERIDESVRRILSMKRELGLWENRYVSLENAREIIGKSEHKSVASEIARKSITLVKDEKGLIPIPVGKSKKMSQIILATRDAMYPYSSTIKSLVNRIHGNVETSFYYQPLSTSEIENIVTLAKKSDFILVTLFIQVRMNVGTVTIDKSHRKLISELQNTEIPTVVISFGSPYVTDVDGIGTYLCGYGYGSISQYAMADALFGAASITGRLPVSLSPRLKRGDGVVRSKQQSLPFSKEQIDFLDAIEVLNSAIRDSIFPGAQVMVTKEGDILWSYQVGNQTYDQNSPKIQENTIYDLASLTKVVATTPVVMKLVETKKLPLDEPISDFFPAFTGKDKDKVTIRHLLTHSSGLAPFFSFELGTTKSQILNTIIQSDLIASPEEKYIYSDLGLILLSEIIRKVTGQSLDQLASSYIYRPLNMNNTMFNPDVSLLPQIAPTEIDTVYHRGLVRGVVHDERAWQLGGVAGHAGLFSNAINLAQYADMMINNGFYGGRRYYKRSTVANFTQRQELPPESERTLGWDTPSPHGSVAGDYFTPGSFGHTGFTGTSMWIDPNQRIAIILLTNRVHPTRKRGGMNQVRRDFHNAVMRSILENEKIL